MKKAYILFLIISLTITLVSCNDAIETKDRIIVKEIGFGSRNMENSMASLIADINNIEAITELSTHIVKCKVAEMTHAQVTDTDSLNFQYSVDIQEIFLNVGDSLKVGDTITVSSAEGIVKASEAAELFKDSSHAQKFGYLQGKYADNEYIISSNWDGIPIEGGKMYIMYLSDEFLEKEGLYAECGMSFLYEYTDGTLYNGKDFNKMDISYKDFIKQLKDSISARTGRADEIGDDAYIEELSEKQAKQREELAQS